MDLLTGYSSSGDEDVATEPNQSQQRPQPAVQYLALPQVNSAPDPTAPMQQRVQLPNPFAPGGTMPSDMEGLVGSYAVGQDAGSEWRGDVAVRSVPGG